MLYNSPLDSLSAYTPVNDRTDGLLLKSNIVIFVHPKKDNHVYHSKQNFNPSKNIQNTKNNNNSNKVI